MGHYSATKNKTMTLIGKWMLSEIDSEKKYHVCFYIWTIEKKIIEMPPKIEERLRGKKKRMRRE